jgi:uncharacterized protein (DUF1501 family)
LAHATAAPANDHYFVFCYFSGGWDLLLGLDPKDPAVFRPELIGDTLIQPGYATILDPTIQQTPMASSVPGMSFGPYIGDLVHWADRMAVVRGMSMDTLTHEVGRKRFITGKSPAGLQARGSSVGTVLAAEFGLEDAIPQLAAKVEAYNVDQPTYASALQVDNTSDLVTVLAPGEVGLDAAADARIDTLLEDFRACETIAASPTLISALDQRDSAKDLVSQGLNELFDFGNSTPEMSLIRDTYGFGSNDLGSAGAQAAMAATALKAGISRVISIRVANGLDTHDNWARDHGSALRPGFDVVAALAADLDAAPYGNDGDSWLDHTTIVGFSEFSRTPLINSRGGRDHALMNACFLLGGGIQGGQVIGASSDVGMSPQAIDLATGQVSPGGVIVRPEHVLRTLMVNAGIIDDINDLRADAITALLA